MDLKIWSPAKRAKGEPLEAWKEAVFRAKLAFGNPLEKQSKENANDFVRSLKKYVVTSAETLDRVDKTFEPNTSKKK